MPVRHALIIDGGGRNVKLSMTGRGGAEEGEGLPAVFLRPIILEPLRGLVREKRSMVYFLPESFA